MPQVSKQHRTARIRDLSLQMVAQETVSGGPGEAAFAGWLSGVLGGMDHFRSNPKDLRLLADLGDTGAQNVVALVRGEGRDCVILAGHYDVVTTRNFGLAEPLAFSPVALRSVLIETLRAVDRTAEEEQALTDLLSGDYLPGRGMLDMKSGLAVGLAVLEQFAAQPQRLGNLLFVATPDEENRSRGMRAFRDSLPGLAREWGLDIRGAINLDATNDAGNGDKGQSMFFGSVGKHAPFAFAIGRGTHVGYPFEGVSTHLIAAEIMRGLDCNPGLSDTAHDESSPPPVCLDIADLRTGYDVTTPDHCWLAFNWLAHRRSAAETLSLFRSEVAAALDRALALQGERARAHGAELQGNAAPRVLDMGELRDLARAADPGIEARLAARAAGLADEVNPLAINRALVALLVEAARIDGPAVVIGFGSLHYPALSLPPGEEGFRRSVEDAVREAARHHGLAIASRTFFPGISDMSFLGQPANFAEHEVLQRNTPALSLCDQPAGEALTFPVVNLGPWGRDCHKQLERLYTPYAFDVLPDLVAAAIGVVLGDAGATSENRVVAAK